MGFGNLEPGIGVWALRFSSENTETVLVVLVTPLILLHGYTRAGCHNWTLPSNLARFFEALRPRVRGWQAQDPSPKQALAQTWV